MSVTNGQAEAPESTDGLRERIAEALCNAQREWMRPGSDAGQHLMTDHMAAAVLAILDAPSPAVDDGLRERYAAAIRDGIINHIDPDHGLEDAVEDAVSDVMRVRDRRMEQLPASRRLIATQIDDLTTRASKDRQRAEIAEEELEALRGGIRETGGDPTRVQNVYAQLSSRTRQWEEVKAERDRLTATLDGLREVSRQQAMRLHTQNDRLAAELAAVRALADRWDNALGVDRSYARALRAALTGSAGALPVTDDLRKALESLNRTIATSSRDWGGYRPDAWLYAVLVGWGCEDDHTHDDVCNGDNAFHEIAQKHHWSAETISCILRYRTAVHALQEAGQ